MRLTDVPSPGYFSNGPALRAEAMKALNYASIRSSQSPDSTTAKDLQAFFTECAKLAASVAPKPVKKETK